MSHTLIVLPDDTAKPIIDAISGATKSLNIRMFLFTDTTLLDAWVAEAPDADLTSVAAMPEGKRSATTVTKS